MPEYHYICYKCQKKFWVNQKMTDKPLLVHENCGGRVTRLVVPVGVIFKGSGFYINDSRKSTEE